jgi:hypothetical protein
MKERVGGAHNEEGLFPRSIRAVAVHESSRLCVTRHTSQPITITPLTFRSIRLIPGSRYRLAILSGPIA